jgi:phosphoserine phosphatase RsbU-like protein/GAF domain-containing protein
VSGPVGAGFRAAYARALDVYLRDPTEAALRAAYEIARDALSRRLSVLDLAEAHNEALLSALAAASGPAEVERVARAAGDFYVEGLSTFEMVQRGLPEARRAVSHARRQTELSRRLSTFLADASLALDTSDSIEEVLRLVTEQARELLGADCCLATVAMEDGPRSVEAASYEHGDRRRWTAFVRWLDLAAVHEAIRGAGGSVRLHGKPLAGLPPFATAAGGPPRAWLAALLTALDGTELGAVQLFDPPGAAFTADDEAALLHLAQMTSAAVERARHYLGPG